jgi:hypothetical protein
MALSRAAQRRSTPGRQPWKWIMAAQRTQSAKRRQLACSLESGRRQRALRGARISLPDSNQPLLHLVAVAGGDSDKNLVWV